jgi:hypothetical protein
MQISPVKISFERFSHITSFERYNSHFYGCSIALTKT